MEKKKNDLTSYSWAQDSILTKTKIPFQFLQQNADILASEKQILLKTYCSELTQAMRCAEVAAVPKRKVRVASVVP